MVQFKKLIQDLQSSTREKDKIQTKLVELKEKLKIKDLYRDDPFTFTNLIQEIKNLKQQLANQDL